VYIVDITYHRFRYTKNICSAHILCTSERYLLNILVCISRTLLWNLFFSSSWSYVLNPSVCISRK